MILTGNYSVDYAAYSVSPDTWADGAEIDLVSIESIEYEAARPNSDGGNEPPYDSCSLVLGDEIGEQWVRVYALVTQESTRAVPLYTGLSSSRPRHEWKGAEEVWSVDLTGTLARAGEKLMPIGWWCQTDPATKAGSLLAENCPAPVTVTEPAANLSSPIYAEEGETNLTMAQKLCDACGYRIRVDADGSITVEPEPETPALTIDEGGNDLMLEDLDDGPSDESDVPNVYRVTTGEGDVAVWRDDDPESQWSTVARGREIWMQETGVSLVEGESASTRAMRGLQTAQHAARTANYSREFADGVHAGDLVEFDMPKTRLSGLWRVTRTSLQCEVGITVDDEVEYRGEKD